MNDRLSTENDIPGFSLGGRRASGLENGELRFWLKYWKGYLLKRNL